LWLPPFRLCILVASAVRRKIFWFRLVASAFQAEDPYAKGMLMRLKAAFVLFIVTLASAAASTAPQQTAPATAPTATTPEQPAASCSEMATALTALMRNDARRRDWAELARYRDANRSLAAPAGGEARVVFMGDSITDAWPQPRFGQFFPGKPYVGRGISGQTTPQMLIRFRPDVIDLHPKAVVILAGTNDIAGNTGPMTDEEIEGNLSSMAELGKSNHIKVVLSSILPVSEYHASPTGVPQTTQRPMTRIRAINEWMRKYAAAEDHVYLDYFPATVDEKGLLRAEFSADDLHPNAAGYAAMAPLAEAAIQKALK
jgi:lysophospholipase L1-like esterase